MKTKKQLEEENKLLRAAFQNLFWMARRYAHGRHTYAPGMVREAYQWAKELGIAIQHDHVIKPPEPSEYRGTSFRSDWLDDCNE